MFSNNKEEKKGGGRGKEDNLKRKSVRKRGEKEWRIRCGIVKRKRKAGKGKLKWEEGSGKYACQRKIRSKTGNGRRTRGKRRRKKRKRERGKKHGIEREEQENYKYIDKNRL